MPVEIAVRDAVDPAVRVIVLQLTYQMLKGVPGTVRAEQYTPISFIAGVVDEA